jgi:cytochrome c oxidase cbb3-type subunit 4
MDINDLRSAVTVVSLLTFLGIVAWAWSRRNQSRFDEAALLPFRDDATAHSTKEPS